jgi:nicotinamide-nucleotide amidase
MQDIFNSDKMLSDLLQIADRLTQTSQKLTVAESCTGGGLSAAITSIPGSSQWFDCGFITYSNEAKQRMLGVGGTSLQRYGAVSEAVAQEMAQGALAHSQAQIAVAITGIAGPGGGSVDKPVGTVWFAWQGRDITATSQCQCFAGDRQRVRQQAVAHALLTLRQLIDCGQGFDRI